MTCPCGSGLAFAACCGPYLSGERQPPTATALMRARYCAYARGDIDFVMRTQEADHEADRDATAAWSRESRWLGFDLVKTEAGAESDQEGKVEFIARYMHKGEEYAHHEEASFRRHGERWLLVDSRMRSSTFRRTQPKVGANDPCPCGSGKKWKKCCGKK